MRYFRKKFTNDEISRRNRLRQLKLESQFYQDFLRKNLTDTKEKIVDLDTFENVFKNEIYYQAMKNLLPNEKEVLYLAYYEHWTLGEVCKILGKSKKEVISLKKQAINHFKDNCKMYELTSSKKKGGKSNG